MNIASWLHRNALQIGDRPALMLGDTLQADYRAFGRRAASLARYLTDDLHLIVGDRVALFMTNRIDYLECLYAILWAGAVAVPVNAKLHAREAVWILADSGARAAFVGAKELHALRSADPPASDVALILVGGGAYQAARSAHELAPPADSTADALAWLFYTSGTTGRPKGVMLSHGNLVAMSLSYLADVDTVDPQDAAYYAAPLSHGAGLYNFIHVRMGARHVVPPSGGFDADEILDLAPRIGPLSLFAAPTMVRRIVEAAKTRGQNGAGIKTIVYGGAPMYAADIDAAMRILGPRLVQVYGQGETPMTITALPRAAHQHPDPAERTRLRASVGYAHSVVDVQIADADGTPLPAGQRGEIEVRGATVMQGYWNAPQTTGQTLRDGWLKTGDLGSLDPDGLLTLVDRSKDLIISGGSNIYPREVEEILLTHPHVTEAAVIGLPDPEWGEIVVACVATSGGDTTIAADLDALCLANIARFKRPKYYLTYTDLPKNNYGKIVKNDLKPSAQARIAAGTHG